VQGAVHFVALILASFGVACASTVDVEIEQRADLAGYCTWNFLTLPDGNVHAPLNDSYEIDVTLNRLVESGLLERGFVRVMDRPDFFVSYFLDVRRQLAVVTETPAMESLPSLDHTPSYEIQVTNSRIERYEIGQLTILVSDPFAQTVVWRGGFAGRFRGALFPHLGDAVASLLTRLPEPASTDRPDACVSRL
jgi:hypothetical protein